MKLVENWKAILKGAWSVKLAAIASILITISEAGASVPHGLFGTAPEMVDNASDMLKYLGYTLYLAGAFVARFLDQGIAAAQIQAALDAAREAK